MKKVKIIQGLLSFSLLASISLTGCSLGDLLPLASHVANAESFANLNDETLQDIFSILSDTEDTGEEGASTTTETSNESTTSETTQTVVTTISQEERLAELKEKYPELGEKFDKLCQLPRGERQNHLRAMKGEHIRRGRPGKGQGTPGKMKKPPFPPYGHPPEYMDGKHGFRPPIPPHFHGEFFNRKKTPNLQPVDVESPSTSEEQE